MARWDAFISYSSADAVAAGRLQRALERYRLPEGRRLRVYRDETDIVGGDLPAQLRQALSDSACLIVGCSEAASASRWVELEIEAFRELAPGRLVLPVLLAGDSPKILPKSLRDGEPRWVDLRPGWRLGLPKAATRVELVRAVAAVADLEFRDLLPLDRQRRRRSKASAIGAAAAVALAAASWPVEHWSDVTPAGVATLRCGTLDDGVAFYALNEPQAVKHIVNVHRAALGGAARVQPLDGGLVPRGRLLPRSVAGAVDARCDPGRPGWVGEPAPGLCVALWRSDEWLSLDDPMGGTEAEATEVKAGQARPAVIDVAWHSLPPADLGDWRANYGRTLTPSHGLPVGAAGQSVWIGLPDAPSLRGSLWHSADGGGGWTPVPRVSDVRSIFPATDGLLLAARVDRQLGFWRLDQAKPVQLAVPGKGDDLEVCGEVDGQPVIRVDRTAYHHGRMAWWMTLLR